MQGIIKSYSQSSKEGKILADSGTTYYFNDTCLLNKNEVNLIKENTTVSFELENISNNYSQVKNIQFKQSKQTGNVKFYNKDKGYGFIFTNEHTKDIYFFISDWKDSSMPYNQNVEFDIYVNKNEQVSAKNITVINNSNRKKDNYYKDNRIECICGKFIVPRIIVLNGAPSHSICPFCGSIVKEFRSSGCFIATAIYNNNYEHPKVKILREFRDKHLLTNKIGTSFVKYYYRYSPRVAEYLKMSPIISYPIKKILDVIVYLLK